MFGIGKLKDEMEEFILENIVANFAPKLKKLFPKVEAGLKKFFEEKQCMVILKREADGDITCMIVKHDAVEVKIKKGGICKDDKGDDMVYSLQQFADMITNGTIQELIKKGMANKGKEDDEQEGSIKQLSE